MVNINAFIQNFPEFLTGANNSSPWLIPMSLTDILHNRISHLGSEYLVKNDVAIHNTAVVEYGAMVKGPAIISPHCFVAASAYMRGGVYLGESAVIGPGCEVKSSVILNNTHLAHFNYIGDSLIGCQVNFEAGAVACNHWNERTEKQITLVYQSTSITTGIEKFGAIIGDFSKIGANAVLSPGTILSKNSIVKRLDLIEQSL